jgi:hypothetical protein
VGTKAKRSTPEKQTLILWALLVRDGAAGFQKDLKPEPDKLDREALEARGLIKVEKRGRYKAVWIAVTKDGLTWAENNLAAPLPGGSTAGSAILQAWLRRLSVYLSGHNVSLASVLGLRDGATGNENGEPHDAPELPPQPSPPQPSPPPPDYAALRARIRQAYLDLTGGRLNARALLADVRAKLADVDRATLDDALKQMQREEEASLYQLDNRAELTDADRAAAIYFGGDPRHILWIER